AQFNAHGTGKRRSCLSSGVPKARNGCGHACYALAWHPLLFKTRSVDAGNSSSSPLGLIGRGEKLPPQLGHIFDKTFFAHGSQKVHSNEQMKASLELGGKSLSQHSQFGFSFNTDPSLLVKMHNAYST
ncbi:hypothetical protein, partial [Dasania phycosphaerae]